ncbi:MAG: phosphatidylglycerophosphatase A [Gammaproteobacteria bacterium]|nr:phosphatidylglycerophosphatase A [Gammaproteobacteria bacterium]
MPENTPPIDSNAEQLRANAFKDPLVVIATGFGIGWIPFAPGTVASLVIALTFFFLVPVVPEANVIQCAVIFLLFICTRLTLGFVVRKYGAKDESCIVLDEFLGMAVALLWVPKEWWLYVIAFLIFRIFDIVKPWPISWVEQRAPGAYGIILDDVIAGAGAAIITQLIWITQ